MDGQQTKTVARELVSRFQADDATGAAAELGFRFLFAIFPFGIFLAALGAFVAAWMRISNPAEQIIAGLGDNLPAELASSLRPELERVIAAGRHVTGRPPRAVGRDERHDDRDEGDEPRL
jgi:uncharacterized BrkB/YihY/UPF0761 family membrane protein